MRKERICGLDAWGPPLLVGSRWLGSRWWLSRTGVRHGRRPLCHTRLSVIPAEAGIHAICGVKGTPNVRRRPITRGALGALVGRRADGRSSHGWAVAWIPACAGMTEGAQE